MKRVLVVAMAIALMAPVSFAGIYYEFQQSSHSDIDQHPGGTLTGRALIEGRQTRIDFVGGTLYPPGTYCVSTDGSRTVFYVDPLSKSFTEVNTSSIAAQVGAMPITIQNLKSSVTKLEDHPIYAGIPTEHYRISLSYDMIAPMKSVDVRQSVSVEIDKWTTVQFGDVSDAFLDAGGIRTGNADLDKLIEIETTKVKGFALRQAVRVTTTAQRGQVPGSKLATFRPVRTTTREFVITRIESATPDASSFVVPASFTRVDPQQLKPPQTQVQMLSLEPSSK